MRADECPFLVEKRSRSGDHRKRPILAPKTTFATTIGNARSRGLSSQRVWPISLFVKKLW